MASLAADGEAFQEAAVFLRDFNDLPDPRQRGKVTYPLDEVLPVCLLAVLAGAETFIDIARFGDKKAYYVLALKGNQRSLREDVEILVAEQKACGFTDTTISQAETVDGDHGRIETRTTTVIHDVAWLQKRHDRPGLTSIVMVESVREFPTASMGSRKIERETRFYITSLVLLANLLRPIVCSHWAIENSLHWVMDMIFRDDGCRIRTDPSSQFHHHRAHGPQIPPEGARQALPAPQTEGRRLGRRLPRKSRRRVKPSPDSPGTRTC